MDFCNHSPNFHTKFYFLKSTAIQYTRWSIDRLTWVGFGRVMPSPSLSARCLVRSRVQICNLWTTWLATSRTWRWKMWPSGAKCKIFGNYTGNLGLEVGNWWKCICLTLDVPMGKKYPFANLFTYSWNLSTKKSIIW